MDEGLFRVRLYGDSLAVPRWLRRRIARLPLAVRQRTIKFLHDHRAAILRRTGGWRQLKPEEFRSIYYRWLERAAQHFARIYVVNIAPTNHQTEAHSPGFGQSILLYNEIIAAVMASLKSDRVFLIDVHAIISGLSPE